MIITDRCLAVRCEYVGITMYSLLNHTAAVLRILGENRVNTLAELTLLENLYDLRNSGQDRTRRSLREMRRY